MCLFLLLLLAVKLRSCPVWFLDDGKEASKCFLSEFHVINLKAWFLSLPPPPPGACFLSRCPGEKCLENYFSTPSILKNTLSFLLVTIYVKNKPPRSRAIEKFHLWFVPEQQRPAGFAAEGKVEPRRRVRGT